MKRFPICLILMIVCWLPATAAVEQVSEISVGDSLLLGYIMNGQFIDAESDEVIYTVRGNLVFMGDTEDKDSIIYLFKSSDLFSRKKSQIFNETSQLELFGCRKGECFLGRSSMLSEDDRLACLQLQDNLLLVLDYNKKEVLAKINNAAALSNGELLAAFVYLEQYFNWKEDAKKRLEARAAEVGNNGTFNYSATIKPRFGNPGYHEWVWDGRVLQRRWVKDVRMEWQYDGEIVRPMYMHHINDEYTWDGELFRPNWRNEKRLEYTVDGDVIKPMWFSDLALEYQVEGQYIRPRWASNPGEDWIVEGDMPLPLVILVIYGLAYR